MQVLKNANCLPPEIFNSAAGYMQPLQDGPGCFICTFMAALLAEL